MSRRAARILLLFTLFSASIGAWAQYPGRVKKQTDDTPPLRATGIFEWTGDLAKPTAGRLVPLAVWDGQNFQPGDEYLAQPAPLAVLQGTVYELQQAGTPKGLFQVNTTENFGAARGENEGNGYWIGVGSVKPEIAVAKAKAPMSKHPPQVVHDAGSDSDRPTLHRKSGSGDTSDSDSNRPVLHRKDSSGSGSGQSGNTGSDSKTSSPASGNGSQTSSNGGAPADPDRPTLHRRDASDSSSGDSGSSSGNGTGSKTDSGQNAPAPDPDRPTLHRKDTSDAGSGSSSTPSVDPDRPTLHKRTDKSSSDGSPVSATASIDPDRPKLRRGKPELPEGLVQPSKLEGVPFDMHQMAAISDAKAGEPHSFAYSWNDPADAAKMKTAMEDLARKALGLPVTASANQTVTNTATNKTTAVTKSRTAARSRAAAAKTSAPAIALEDETFKAFELSYSGGATLVLTAKAPGDNGNSRYITLIAQPDFYGTPQVIFTQTTSDDQLNVKPRMKLVDAADTDADNRAELIFELQGKSDRSFSIYRVVNMHADEAFNTGPVL